MPIKSMADDSRRFDFTESVNKLEEINSWFQNEDIDLDEGLQKLKVGKELIKKCRVRLQDVENEFIKIKKEFVDEAQNDEASDTFPNEHRPNHKSPDEEDPSPDKIPF
jgi:exodeoxyribonuclease VII small subunit